MRPKKNEKMKEKMNEYAKKICNEKMKIEVNINEILSRTGGPRGGSSATTAVAVPSSRLEQRLAVLI